MSITDPLADFLTRIRNAHLAKHDRVDVPASRLKLEICRILKEEGFIRNFRMVEGKPERVLRVFLRYGEDGSPAITHLARVSRPGRRVYMGADQIRPVLNGMGLGIISTNQGVVADRSARERRLGGEILCEVW
ncbi:MAG: 30S ribosomal protein S8 [Acidobacteria bacterium RBG_16_64_8]|nr:MAG: 30S ribosomal protein S8 [Acidobacteria bacterium RBG_16_64_8]